MLQNYDLDVMNVLKSFPEDDENCVFYARGRVNIKKKKGKSSFVKASGEIIALSNMFYSIMNDTDGFDEVLLNAALNYLKENKEQREYFLNCL